MICRQKTCEKMLVTFFRMKQIQAGKNERENLFF